MSKLEKKRAFGKTGLCIPSITFGTSCLGNLYRELEWDAKLGIVREWFNCVACPIFADSAGKYGAGLALEEMGKALKELHIPSDSIVISNKLGWLRAPLETPEPRFEPGTWAGLKHDAVHDISYEGIFKCWEEGLSLLGGEYNTELLSVHDPDEYLASASDRASMNKRMEDIREAYRALAEIKKKGKAKAIGVGAKDWKTIRLISDIAELDWVMFANSLTVMRHPPELLRFMEELAAHGVGIVNSAVFHAGFLSGGDYFDYRLVSESNPSDAPLFAWRSKFKALCERFGTSPAAACVQFGLSVPGVVSVSLNTSRSDRVQENVSLVDTQIDPVFWTAMKDNGLISEKYPYLG